MLYTLAFALATLTTPAVAVESPAASADTGKLYVRAFPWARCTVDGGASRITPISRQVSVGTHTVICTYASHKPQTKFVKVVAGQKTEVMFKMRKRVTPPPTPTRKAPAGYGTLIVHGLPWAKCTVAGKTRTTWFQMQLKPGDYPITCVRGKRTQKDTVTIVADKSTALTIDMR